MVSDFVVAFILAVIQGISEWFPISSSGHLVLASYILGFENSLAFDVALHFGTLMAVFVYFGKDITDILRDVLSFKFKTDNGKMGLFLIIATIPAAFIGFLLRHFIENSLNNLYLLALGFSITGVLLLISSLDVKLIKNNKLSYGIALGIGLFQVASLFRGISRSASTICGGVLLGLDQKKAARFSFLMSIPIIFGANLLTIGTSTIPTNYFWAALVSFVVGLATIHVLLKFVLTNRRNLRWFGIYVLVVAISLGLWLAFQ